MKKLTGLLVLTAALMLVLPTPRARAATPPAGPFFLCVNTTEAAAAERTRGYQHDCLPSVRVPGGSEY
jgi:hypothetical protein